MDDEVSGAVFVEAGGHEVVHFVVVDHADGCFVGELGAGYFCVECGDGFDLPGVLEHEADGDGWEAVVPGRGAAWPLDVPIPVERAQWLIDHAGGLMVGGGHYGGVAGLDSDPTSGQITITWKKEEQ